VAGVVGWLPPPAEPALPCEAPEPTEVLIPMLDAAADASSLFLRLLVAVFGALLEAGVPVGDCVLLPPPPEPSCFTVDVAAGPAAEP